MPEQSMTIDKALTWAYDYARPWSVTLADAFKKERARREAAEKVVEAAEKVKKADELGSTPMLKLACVFVLKALEAYDKERGSREGVMSKEPFQDLVTKVEAEQDTRRKIWIVREYDLKRNGTKNNQIESLRKELADANNTLSIADAALETERQFSKSFEKERDEAIAQVGELREALKEVQPYFEGEHSSDHPSVLLIQTALSRPAPKWSEKKT